MERGLPDGGYWIEPGRLAGGPFPGAPDVREARARLAALTRIGVRAFIDLTEPGERLDPYEHLLSELPGGSTPLYVRLPMRSGSAPTALGMAATLALIDHLLQADDGAIYLHCRRGTGRSATVAGCRAVELGRPLAELPAPRHAAQRRFVAGWSRQGPFMPRSGGRGPAGIR